MKRIAMEERSILKEERNPERKSKQDIEDTDDKDTDMEHRCIKRFLLFIIFFIKKRVFNLFYILKVFYFSRANFFYSTKPPKLLHKTMMDLPWQL